MSEEASRICRSAKKPAGDEEKWFFDPFVPDRVTIDPNCQGTSATLPGKAFPRDCWGAAMLEFSPRSQMARILRLCRRLRHGRSKQAYAADPESTVRQVIPDYAEYPPP
jgi:hypothetical protein